MLKLKLEVFTKKFDIGRNLKFFKIKADILIVKLFLPLTQFTEAAQRRALWVRYDELNIQKKFKGATFGEIEMLVNTENSWNF